MLLVMVVMMVEVVVQPHGDPSLPLSHTPPSKQSAHSHTWWPPSLPFLPRSKQLDAREHVQLARLLVGAFAVARAAAAATRVRLLPLPRLPLLADQGAGDGRCPGHVPPVERDCEAVRTGGRQRRTGSRMRRWGGVCARAGACVCVRRGEGVYTTHGSVRITHRPLQSRAQPR